MNGKKLKVTTMMQRLMDRAKKESTKDEFKGETVVISDFFVKAMESVPGIKIEDFDFYYYAFRSEMIDKMPGLDIQFDYKGQARGIKEVDPWHEILPKIMRVNCGAYTLVYNGSKIVPIENHCRVVIHYQIQKNELPEKVINIEAKPMRETILKDKIKNKEVK